MLAGERQRLILDRLRAAGRVRATDLARDLNVSEITVRRDLATLESEGALSRVHGGAVLKASGKGSPTGVQQTVVGIVVPSSSHYFSEVIRGAEAAAEQYGIRLILGTTEYGAREQDRVQQMIKLGAQGILLATAAGDSDPASATWLDGVGIPVVLMERSFGSPTLQRELDHVRTDHRLGALLAIRHLQNLGHDKIAVGFAQTATTYWLQRGVEDAREVLELRNPLDVALLGPARGAVEPARLETFLDDSLAQGATAFFIHNDMPAALLVDLALRRGLRVPEDLAVVAYDDVTAAMAAVPLTAIATPKHALGSYSVEDVLRRIRSNPASPSPVSHRSLIPALRIRDSCGAISRVAAAK